MANAEPMGQSHEKNASGFLHHEGHEEHEDNMR